MPETGISTIVEEARRFIADHYEEHFGDKFPFHDHLHALRVYKSINSLAEAEGLSHDEREVLSLAALFHDSGYYMGAEGHEQISAEIAEDFLKKRKYPADRIEVVKDCILATIPAQLPQNKLHQLMQDADMSHLGRKDYIELLNKLKQEWESTGSKFRKSGWWNMNAEFLKTHNFHTQSARDLYG
jgi:predicted metal-dependent HD superfamily phosphohydrolase